MFTTNASQPQSPFLRLPPELRLDIYKLLLHHDPHPTDRPGFIPIPPNYREFEMAPSSSKQESSIIRIRAQDPSSYEISKHLRSTFIVRSGMRARCINTTYFPISSSGIYTSLLLANAQIHAEAVEILYSNHTFDFDTHIEAFVAFVTDLTPRARDCLRSIRLVKRALPYEKEFDRAEWAIAMECLCLLDGLKFLSLGVVVGRPGPDGWDMVPAFQVEHFDLIKNMEGMEWLQELLKVKGLEHIEVDAVVEHCPLPRSVAMARYIQFSASVEGPFQEFLKGRMIG